MALRSQSLFLYGFNVVTNNKYIDFNIVSGGAQLTATLTEGYYSLTDLLNEIQLQLSAADPTNVYTVTADRTVSGGTQNRVTIATSGAFLSLLFATGTHHTASAAVMAGFAATDLTGSTSYTGVSSAGTAVLTTMTGYSHLGNLYMPKNFGAVNVTASGLKEAVVFSIQQFIQVGFMYEPQDYVNSTWYPFMIWAISQKPYDFTPEITAPTVFFDVTLESTESDGSGLGFNMTEMLPEHPFLYKTGNLKMRVRN